MNIAKVMALLTGPKQPTLLSVDVRVTVPDRELPEILSIHVPGIGAFMASAHGTDTIRTFHNSSPFGEHTTWQGGWDSYHQRHDYPEPIFVGFDLTWKYEHGRFEIKSREEMNGFSHSMPVKINMRGWGAGICGERQFIETIRFALSQVFTERMLLEADLRQAESCRDRLLQRYLSVSPLAHMEYEESREKADRIRKQLRNMAPGGPKSDPQANFRRRAGYFRG